MDAEGSSPEAQNPSSRRGWRRLGGARMWMVLVIVLAAALAWFWLSKSQAPAATTPNQAEFSIELKHGSVVGGPATYSVAKGTKLQFTITSDGTGAIGVPTNPPQKIEFTKSPLVFSLDASSAGKFQLSYEASGSPDVILIGTIQVKEK